MIQTRFENEQFNSLPLVFANNRSKNDYITTDRPDSSQLVDLHIYIIPKSIWKNVQHLAQNEAMEDAISAGFIRVSPEMKLRNLREKIELLCGKEDYFPREFIFLRSVGRCLTRVKQKQENELKVKNYRPPQILASEIYLLEGRHEDYGNIPSASPALSSASYVFGNRRQHRFHVDDHNQALSKVSHHYDRKPLRTGKDNLPALLTNHITYRRPISSRKSRSRFSQILPDLDQSSPNTSVVTSVTARELAKLKEEQERLRRRQAELERIRRAAEERKLNSEREENERQRRRQEQLEREEKERHRRRLEELELEEKERQRQRDEQLGHEEKEHQRQRDEQLDREEKERHRRRLSQLEREEKERQRQREEQLEHEEKELCRRRLEQLEREEKERKRRKGVKEQFERDEQERRRRLRRQQKAEAERRRLEKLELAATTIQASFRGYHERQTFRERQKNLMKNRSRRSSKKSDTTLKNEKKIDTNDDELSDSSHIISRTSIGSTSDLDSNPSRPETRTIKKEKKKTIRSDSSSSSSSLHLKTEHFSTKNKYKNDDDERCATVTKTRHSDEEFLPISTSDINDDDTYEIRRREAGAKGQQQSDEDKRKAKEYEDQWRRELSKRQAPEDVLSLRARLEELRSGRVTLEKQRDDVIKQLRHMHQRITLRRRDARDMWKKKYFQEKKKTPTLEDRSAQLKIDLDLIRGKILQIIDHETKHAAQLGSSREAELGNLILRIVRIQNDTQDLQRQFDQAKLRLTTDLKLRNQADSECQLLKHELIQAKMNLAHIKNRSAT